MSNEPVVTSAEQYERVLRDIGSDEMAAVGIPQRFWPPQVVDAVASAEDRR